MLQEPVCMSLPENELLVGRKHGQLSAVMASPSNKARHTLRMNCTPHSHNTATCSPSGKAYLFVAKNGQENIFTQKKKLYQQYARPEDQIYPLTWLSRYSSVSHISIQGNKCLLIQFTEHCPRDCIYKVQQTLSLISRHCSRDIRGEHNQYDTIVRSPTTAERGKSWQYQIPEDSRRIFSKYQVKIILLQKSQKFYIPAGK